MWVGQESSSETLRPVGGIMISVPSEETMNWRGDILGKPKNSPSAELGRCDYCKWQDQCFCPKLLLCTYVDSQVPRYSALRM